MAPMIQNSQEQKERNNDDLKNIKEGTVSKIKREVRTKDTMLIKKEDINKTTKAVKRNYNLNKLSQVRKMVFKNKMVAPINITHHTNDVLVKYSPAVFKNAVEVVTDEWKEGKKFETTKLKIEVVKRRAAVDQSGAKVDSLISFLMSSTKGARTKITQTVHVYNTSHSLMIQGARLLNGVKGCKWFLEDFLQPLLEREIENKGDAITRTEDILSNVKMPDVSKEKDDIKSTKSSR